MPENDTILLIVFSIAILGIIFATVFVPSFQEKVLGGSEGETSLFGVITLKGVTFVLVVLGLAGMLYMTVKKDNGSTGPSAELGAAGVISYLKKNPNLFHYSIQPNGEDSIDLQVNNSSVGSVVPNLTLKTKKHPDRDQRGIWQIKIGSTILGNIKMDEAYISLKFKEKNPVDYIIDDAYEIGDSEFWFKIDSIYSSGNVARYIFKFGEGPTKEKIIWCEKSYTYGKTDKGSIPVDEDMKFIKEPAWKYSYSLALGAGLYGENDKGLYISQLNIMAIKRKITPYLGN